VPSRVCFFAWLASKDKLQTHVNLHKKRILDNDICEICSIAPKFVPLRQNLPPIFSSTAISPDSSRLLLASPSPLICITLVSTSSPVPLRYKIGASTTSFCFAAAICGNTGTPKSSRANSTPCARLYACASQTPVCGRNAFAHTNVSRWMHGAIYLVYNLHVIHTMYSHVPLFACW
jgi:hypothetical protein